MANYIRCPICGSNSHEIMHKVINGIAVTSDSNYSTSIDPYLCYCTTCSYFFTLQGRPLKEYYAAEYSLLMQNFHTDQILIGKKNQIKRAEYQASLIKSIAHKLNIKHLLEVGAGKGLTAHHIVKDTQLETIALHDPGAERYQNVWANYVHPTSVHSTLEEFMNVKFDLGFTFFTLEHTESPAGDLDMIISSMQKNCVFVGIVPWLCANPGDLLVGDHCSHFTLRSLNELLNRYNINYGLEYRILVNEPLRGLVYVCSKSIEEVDRSVRAVLEGEYSKDFILPEQVEEPHDLDMLKLAKNHWFINVEECENKRHILWGAGFYSKLIMLRHPDINFEICVDSNPSLVGTNFVRPDGLQIVVSSVTEWLESASSEDRLWLGVSHAARNSICATYSKILNMKGIIIVC